MATQGPSPVVAAVMLFLLCWVILVFVIDSDGHAFFEEYSSCGASGERLQRTAMVLDECLPDHRHKDNIPSSSIIRCNDADSATLTIFNGSNNCAGEGQSLLLKKDECSIVEHRDRNNTVISSRVLKLRKCSKTKALPTLREGGLCSNEYALPDCLGRRVRSTCQPQTPTKCHKLGRRSSSRISCGDRCVSLFNDTDNCHDDVAAASANTSSSSNSSDAISSSSRPSDPPPSYYDVNVCFLRHFKVMACSGATQWAASNPLCFMLMMAVMALVSPLG